MHASAWWEWSSKIDRNNNNLIKEDVSSLIDNVIFIDPGHGGKDNGTSYNLIVEDELNLKKLFNRNYTEGYFNGNGKIISDVQSHIGIFVGKVYKVKNGKKFNEILWKIFCKS